MPKVASKILKLHVL